jgi:signal transduction histidine kinase/ligand-binding sensor domain-containing protein
MHIGRLGLLVGVSILGTATVSLNVSGADRLGVSAQPFEVWHDEGNWWLQDSVTAIVQTHDGYIWLGTYHGLVRFDGLNFTVFDSGNAPALPNGRITSLYESGDHVLWIGHETGQLSKIAAGEFRPVKLGENWPGGVVEAITSDEADNVWLLNDNGVLYRVNDDWTATIPGGASALRKATLAKARDGRIWMTSNGKVATLERGQAATIELPVDSTGGMVERVFAATDGGIWVLGQGKLRKWRAGAWQETIEAALGPAGSIGVAIETRYGLLAGTMHAGLYLLRPGLEPLHFTRADGLSHDWVRALTVDAEGNCWIGTGAGFDGLRPRNVRMVAPADGWQGCAVRSFLVEPDGGAWVGTEGAGLYHYDGREWSVFNEQKGLPSLFVWSVLRTKTQQLLVGTWGGGLYERSHDRFQTPPGLSKVTAPVTALYQGRSSEVWIGTQEGLYRLKDGGLVLLAGKEQLVVPDIRTIAETSDGTLWFGMLGGGLGALKDGALKQFRKADGLSSDLVTCLFADADATLWIGTSDNGLTRLKDQKFSTINVEHGLLAKGVTHIVDDGAGYFWMGSFSGILRVSKADLNLCADGKADQVRCLSYGRAEGLTTQICTSGFQPGACRSSDGQLWFPTIKGLATLDPGNVASNSVPPPVSIEALLVDGKLVGASRSEESPAGGAASDPPARRKSVASSESPGLAFSAEGTPLRIRPGRHRFEFRYVALSFVAPEKVRYSRMLEGLENDWVDAGVKRSAEYQYLPPAQYTFHVIACNNDGVWNRGGASLAFTVLPFFWQTFGFRLGSVTGGAAALATGVFWASRRRLRRQLEISERQHAVERERGRIARDMHDELGASLTRISLLSESVLSETSAQPQVAADADQIHSTAREVIRSMDEIVWAVNPAYDTLDSLVAYLGRYAERYLDAVGIRCRLDVPMQVPRLALNAEVRHNVFLAFKEALHNVVKHAHATEVRISIELGMAGFVVLVVDDGSGFDLNGAEQPRSASLDDTRLASGNGLVNMRKRMQEIGGTCEWDTAPGRGTRLKLAVLIKS